MKPHQEPGEEEPLGPAGSSPQASAGPDPDSAEAWFQRGLAAFRQGRLGQAAGDFHQALKRDPGHAKAWYQLGNLFFAQDRLAEAATHYLQALQHNPAHANACSQLGCVWLRQAQISRALGCFLRALELNPANALTWHHLGNAYKGQGQLDQALDAFERGLALQAGTPLTRADPLRMMNYHAWLQTLNYHPGYTPEVCFQAHRTWGERLSLSLAPLARPAQVRPAGPLRIGYVSAVFRHHAAAFFIESLLKAHDRRDFEIFCYSGLPRPDAVTRRLQSLADHWREVHGLDDRAAAEQIQRDRIDILVDLDGHTAHTRLPLFALKPAPVQVSYLGYPNTTGLSRIDYRLTDAWADPPGLTEAWHTEELVRLP
ncbi:MAG TPA: tetratricopeptide repeat protein, partial [Candidatus Obscuribacterales bacterium]